MTADPVQPLPDPVLSVAEPAQIWKDRLERFATSGLRVVDFCRAEGVRPQAFYHWKRKFARTQPASRAEPARLLPVQVVTRRETAAAVLELVLSGGSILRLTPGCDLNFVRILVQTLGRTPC